MKGENVQGTGAQAPSALTLSAAMQVTQVPSLSHALSCPAPKKPLWQPQVFQVTLSAPALLT